MGDRWVLFRRATDAPGEAFRSLVRLATRAIEIEKTSAGRINIVGAVAALVLALIIGLPAVLSAIVQLFRPESGDGASLVWIFGLFVGYLLLCVVTLAYLGEPGRRD